VDPPEKRMAPSSVAAPVSAPGTTAAPSSSSNAVVKALPLPPPDTRWLAPQGLTWRPESHVILRGAPTPRWWVLACLRQQQEGRGRSGGGKQPAAARQEGSSGSAGRIEWQWALHAGCRLPSLIHDASQHAVPVRWRCVGQPPRSQPAAAQAATAAAAQAAMPCAMPEARHSAASRLDRGRAEMRRRRALSRPPRSAAPCLPAACLPGCCLLRTPLVPGRAHTQRAVLPVCWEHTAGRRRHRTARAWVRWNTDHLSPPLALPAQ
jgi:hypothetical protein